MSEGGQRDILVALSGGQDSCALLHSLALLREECGLTLFAAHLNHGIRGADADEDRQFAESFSASLGIRCASTRVEVRDEARRTHRSLQEAARNARRRFLASAAEELNAECIALGHTQDDLIETVLLNIMRGTGTDGLRGLPARSGRILRPLLSVTRKETGEYCREHGISYRKDASNLSLRYRRNRVREELLPQLAAYYNPAIREAILRLSDSAGADSELLRMLAEDGLKATILKRDADSVELNRAGLAGHHPALGRRILRLAAESVRGDLSDVGFDSVESALLSAVEAVKFSITLPGAGVCISGDSERVRIGRVKPESSPLPFEVVLDVPGCTETPMLGGRFRVETESVTEGFQPPSLGRVCVVDADSVRGRLFARNRRQGDRIQPFGMMGTKKLQDLLVDKKAPKELRDRIPVVADEEGILWVVGIAVSERSRISAETRRILKITFEPQPNE